MARTLATMLAGTSDITWKTPKARKRVTCDTMVEITETPGVLDELHARGVGDDLTDPHDERLVGRPDVRERRMPALLAHEAPAVERRSSPEAKAAQQQP